MIRQRSTGWAIHLGLADFGRGPTGHPYGFLGFGTGTHIFRTRAAARKNLYEQKTLKNWPWPRARVVAVDITVKVRG